MYTLSTISFLEGLVWTDRHHSQRVEQSVLTTLGGQTHFYEAGKYSGIPITLESLQDQGWQTLEIVDAVLNLASQANATYLLITPQRQYSVRFRHEDPPAFQATTMNYRETPVSGDYFLITMKFLTV